MVLAYRGRPSYGPLNEIRAVMTHPTFPHPLNRYVEQNTFRDRRYEPQAIIPFQEARAQLPKPVLPEQNKWLEMYWRAWEIAWSHLRQPKAKSGFVANFIDTAFNDHAFMWDSAFMTQFGVYGRRAFDFQGTLDNFYAKQHDDGYICREINTYDGYDYFYPFDPNGTGPNVLAWAEWRSFRHTRDEERLARVFWPLMALHEWFRAHRTWRNGLYWATGLSSGMDNQPRVPGGMLHHGHWTWMDANMQASLNCRVLAQMAQLLEQAEVAQRLNEERALLHREVNAHMWDEESGFYYDVDPQGHPGRTKSIGAYWALLDKDFVPEERREPFLRHLRDPEQFNRPHRVPSLSADNVGYDPETGNYWCGGVWSPTNYVVLKGLRRVGQRRLAHEIAVNHLDNVCQVFQRTDTFWENYAPEGAAPGKPSKENFVGWTGVSAISILLEDAIGLKVDWPLRQITWDRRLTSAEPYGVRNYPLGADSRLNIVGDDEAIEIDSDSPFTLIVHAAGETLRTAVPSGATTLSLKP